MVLMDKHGNLRGEGLLLDREGVHLTLDELTSAPTPRPTHSGPPSQSLVITTGVPPVTVRYPPGRVQQYTRHAIAKGTGVTTSHVSGVFTARRTPSLAYAIKLANFLSVSLDYLIFTLIPETSVRVADVTARERERLVEENNRQAAERMDRIITK